MSSELVKIDPSLPALPSTGMEDVKVRPSIIKMFQASSENMPENARPGYFQDSLDGSIMTEISAIPLIISIERNLFPKNSGFKGKPICKSFNGIEPVRDEPYQPMANTCEECQYSKWGPRVNGKPTRPECGLTNKMLYLDVETRLPKLFYFRGLGISKLREFLGLLKAKMIMAKAKGKNLNLFDFKFTMKGIKHPGSAAYMPLFSKVEAHGEDISYEFGEYVRNLQSFASPEEEETFNDVTKETFEEV